MDVNHLRYAVIVDPYSSGNLFAGEFAKRGIEVIAVLSSSEPPDVFSSSYRPDDFCAVFIAPQSTLQELAEKLAPFRPICVLTGCETGVELAEQLAPIILPAFSNEITLAPARRDKGLMAQAAIDKGVAMMRQICTNDLSQVQQWLDNLNLSGKDLVIKPPKSSSTDSVTKLIGGQGLEKAFFELVGKPNRLGIINDRVLVQEYLSGTEYVVDTFTYEKNHTICNICKYTKLNHQNGMAIYDRMDWISENNEIVDVLEAYAYEVLNALEIKWGNAHIEIMMTNEGPRLIEVGARPHGAGHPRLSYIATGSSQVHRTVNYFADGLQPSPRYSLIKNMTVIFLRALKPSIIKNVQKLHELSKLSSYIDSSIQVTDHQSVPATQDLFATLALGFVVLANADLIQLERDVAEVRAAERLVFHELCSVA